MEQGKDFLGKYYNLRDFEQFSKSIVDYLKQIELDKIKFPHEVSPNLRLVLSDDRSLNDIYNSGLNSAFTDILYLFLFGKNYLELYNKEMLLRFFISY
ncbi:MAG: hypothetical protein ACLFPL_04205 [Candidatus Nanoarchaeia archaeon]